MFQNSSVKNINSLHFLGQKIHLSPWSKYFSVEQVHLYRFAHKNQQLLYGCFDRYEECRILLTMPNNIHCLPRYTLKNI